MTKPPNGSFDFGRTGRTARKTACRPGNRDGTLLLTRLLSVQDQFQSRALGENAAIRLSSETARADSAPAAARRRLASEGPRHQPAGGVDRGAFRGAHR